jgi:hypothetical protein
MFTIAVLSCSFVTPGKLFAAWVPAYISSGQVPLTYYGKRDLPTPLACVSLSWSSTKGLSEVPCPAFGRLAFRACIRNGPYQP